MQFRLRTLLMVLAVGPVVLWCVFLFVAHYHSGPDKVDIDVMTGAWPETALQLQAYKNDIVGMRNELGNAPSIDKPDSRGWTALHWAAIYNCREAVQVLLENGASDEVRDHFGYLPIDYAQDQTIRELLERSAEELGTVNKDAE